MRAIKTSDQWKRWGKKVNIEGQWLWPYHNETTGEWRYIGRDSKGDQFSCAVSLSKGGAYTNALNKLVNPNETQ